MFPLGPSENIKKPNISLLLIRTCACAYQEIRNVRFSEVFMGIKREHWKEKRLTEAYSERCQTYKVERFAKMTFLKNNPF